MTTKLKFPTHLRKMWSGSEVQEWLDKQQAEHDRMYEREQRVIKPPEPRYWCSGCGIIKDGKHNSWACKLFLFIDKIFGK